MGSKRDDNDELNIEADKLLWGIYQFTITLIIIALIVWPISKVWGEVEQVWTDFSPEPVVIIIEDLQEDKVIVMVKDEPVIDKEKYRVYFEDRELVMMVLGGIEWWYSNCGTLSGPGNYFMSAAIVKHEIGEEEMQKSLIFQTGHFAAALYNNCDVFLEQTKTIGLDIMLEKTQKLELETVDNLSSSEV